jgi:poly(A) polymerase
MINLLDKIFSRTNNLDYIAQGIKNLVKQTPVRKIFDSINDFSSESEIRFVGGCVRKIINKELIDDIDLATNLNPEEVSEALKKHHINFYETGIEYGTVTAIIDNYKFEITSLREDIESDGRHSKVKFSSNWKKDASRRDFSINSIYSDIDGNLFDPFNGKKDLEKGLIKFIGNPEERVKEDYLRILRYLRFFLNYSKNNHNSKTLRILRKNIGGISNLSKDRLLDELKKYIKSKVLTKLSNDKVSTKIFKLFFHN